MTKYNTKGTGKLPSYADIDGMGTIYKLEKSTQGKPTIEKPKPLAVDVELKAIAELFNGKKGRREDLNAMFTKVS